MSTQAPERRQLHMNVPDDIHLTLKRAAVERRTSMTDIVIEMIRERFAAAEELNAR